MAENLSENKNRIGIYQKFSYFTNCDKNTRLIEVINLLFYLLKNYDVLR